MKRFFKKTPITKLFNAQEETLNNVVTGVNAVLGGALKLDTKTITLFIKSQIICHSKVTYVIE